MRKVLSLILVFVLVISFLGLSKIDVPKEKVSFDFMWLENAMADLKPQETHTLNGLREIKNAGIKTEVKFNIVPLNIENQNFFIYNYYIRIFNLVVLLSLILTVILYRMKKDGKKRKCLIN